jgi:hypothetical protein
MKELTCCRISILKQLKYFKIINCSPGFGAPLNEQETVDFLTTGKLNIHLGTIDEKDHPNVHPTWFYYDTENNRMYIQTSKHGDCLFFYSWKHDQLNLEVYSDSKNYGRIS